MAHDQLPLRAAGWLLNKGFSLVLVSLTIAALFHNAVRAEGQLVVTVNDARSAAGQTVGITVSIRGLAGLDGVTGLSGGQFELSYNNAAAVVENIRPGSLIAQNFTFIPNRDYSGNSIKVAWAAAGAVITGDGDLANITFSLRQTGGVSPEFKNIVLYDQDLKPVAVTAAVVANAGGPASGAGEGRTAGGAASAAEQPASGGASPGSGESDEAAEQPEENRIHTAGAAAPDDRASPSGGIPQNGSPGLVGRMVPYLFPAAVLSAGGIGFFCFRRKIRRRRRVLRGRATGRRGH